MVWLCEFEPDQSMVVSATRTIHHASELKPVPSAVTAQPVIPGDAADGLAQRVFFPAGSSIDPQLTVSLSDQSLYGYIARGQSTSLPPGMTVRYSSDHPGVVTVSCDGSGIRAAGAGVATVTATVRYQGKSATARFVIDVS